MPITLDGTSGITTPGLTNTGTETVVNLNTTGNTIIGDATTDTLTVGVTGIVKDASGNVGIGTASPASGRRLTVTATATDSTIRIDAPTGYYSYLELTENGSLTSGNYWQIVKIPTTNALQFWNGAERMRIESSGNSGIGIISPLDRLHVLMGTTPSNGTGIAIQGINSGGASSQPGLQFLNNAGTYLGGIYADNGTGFVGINAKSSNHIRFTINNAEIARFDTSGNLGVGTSSPSTFGKVAVEVPGTTTPTSFTTVGPSSINLYAATNGGSTNGTAGIFGWNATTGLGSGIGFSRENGVDWGTQIRFYTHPTATTNIGDITERMRITSGGSVLIGKTSGSTYLNVSTAFDYLATTFTSGAGNYGYLALPQTPSVTLMLVNLTNQNNGNLNMAFLLLCNTRSTSHGGGNGVSVVSATQNSTGTGGEISTYAFALSGSGTSISLRATCTLVSGSAVIDFTARIIQI
jgi:hypothetical protein